MRERGVRTGLAAGAGSGSATAAESAAACICRELRRQYAIDSLPSWRGWARPLVTFNLSQCARSGSGIRTEFAQDFAFSDARGPYSAHLRRRLPTNTLNFLHKREKPGP